MREWYVRLGKKQGQGMYLRHTYSDDGSIFEWVLRASDASVFRTVRASNLAKRFNGRKVELKKR